MLSEGFRDGTEGVREGCCGEVVVRILALLSGGKREGDLLKVQFKKSFENSVH